MGKDTAVAGGLLDATEPIKHAATKASIWRDFMFVPARKVPKAVE